MALNLCACPDLVHAFLDSQFLCHEVPEVRKNIAALCTSFLIVSRFFTWASITLYCYTNLVECDLYLPRILMIWKDEDDWGFDLYNDFEWLWIIWHLTFKIFTKNSHMLKHEFISSFSYMIWRWKIIQMFIIWYTWERNNVCWTFFLNWTSVDGEI